MAVPTLNLGELMCENGTIGRAELSLEDYASETTQRGESIDLAIEIQRGEFDAIVSPDDEDKGHFNVVVPVDVLDRAVKFLREEKEARDGAR